MHYQAAPHEEAKLVSCAKGAIHEVIVHLQRHSLPCAGESDMGTYHALEADLLPGRILNA